MSNLVIAKGDYGRSSESRKRFINHIFESKYTHEEAFAILQRIANESYSAGYDLGADDGAYVSALHYSL